MNAITPPRFGPGQIQPETNKDWTDLYRWFTSVTQVINRLGALASAITVGTDGSVTINIALNLPTDLPVYSGNADALAGGLVPGNTYRDSAGILFVVF